MPYANTRLATLPPALRSRDAFRYQTTAEHDAAPLVAESQNTHQPTVPRPSTRAVESIHPRSNKLPADVLKHYGIFQSPLPLYQSFI